MEEKTAMSNQYGGFYTNHLTRKGRVTCNGGFYMLPSWLTILFLSSHAIVHFVEKQKQFFMLFMIVKDSVTFLIHFRMFFLNSLMSHGVRVPSS